MQEVNIISRLNERDSERIKNYRALLDFYNGKQWQGGEKWNEKRITFNYARVMIDKLTSYLMSGMDFIVEPLDKSEESRKTAVRAEADIRQVYLANDLEQMDFETEIDCAVLGDGCYKVVWDEEAGEVRVTAPDVQGVHAWWTGDNLSRVWRVASRYSLTSEEAEMLYGIRPANKTAVIVESWTDSVFELYLDNVQIDKQANPYGFIPFVIFPNLREPKKFWGYSDLLQIMEPQRELNRAMSQISRILELSGNPVAVLENVEESKDIAVRPGAVWNIPEDAKAYLLDLLQGGGLRLHIDYIELLYRTLHDISESPRAAFGGAGRDLSGVAMQIELYPLMQKVLRKRAIRSTAYNRRNRMILKLLEKFRGEKYGENRLEVNWGPILPQDTAEEISNEKTLVESGLHSRRKAMRDLGINDPEAEFVRWLEEKEAILTVEKQTSGEQAHTA